MIAVLAGCGGSGDRPSVVLVVIDTFRADHAGFEGYSRPLTPSLDSLARSGACYTGFHAQSSWTLPAIATMMTGLPPRIHAAGRRDGLFYGIDPSLPTMAEIFNDAGYRTAAFFNVIFLGEDFGFHAGFDHFDCRGFANRAAVRRAGETVDAFLGWLDAGAGGGPFLAVIHFYDPHLPYDPPAPWSGMFTDPSYDGPCDSAWGTVTQLMMVNEGTDTLSRADLDNLMALYDGELAYADAQLGRLLSALRARGLSGSTVVLVTADHGEEFLEHGRVEHGNNLFEETTRVPMVLAGPGVPPGTRTEACSQMDILPTLASLCGVEAPPLPGAVLTDTPARRLVYASGVLWRDDDMASCTDGAVKVIWDAGADSAAAWDLEADPLETSPSAPDPALLDSVLAYWASPPAAGPSPVRFAETVERSLRDLGYIR
jgi:arylsulfatase A-like enzyme